jgi:hypothetical protein
MVTDITIHVESAEGTLERIDHSVTVLVELLKVVVEDLTCLGIWRSTSSAITAGVIPLRLLEHSMVREVWFRLDDNRWTPFYSCFPMATDLSGSPIGSRLTLCDYSHRLARFSPGRLLGTCFG